MDWGPRLTAWTGHSVTSNLLLSVSPDDWLLSVYSFSLVNVCNCLVQCEGWVQLNLLQELNTNDDSIRNHLTV